MKERVLLVDDEVEFLEIMAERMRARDMEVTTSTSATEALSLIATESYDAVIMDFMMPEMDGIQALEGHQGKKAGDADHPAHRPCDGSKGRRGHEGRCHGLCGKTGGPGRPGGKNQKGPPSKRRSSSRSRVRTRSSKCCASSVCKGSTAGDQHHGFHQVEDRRSRDGRFGFSRSSGLERIEPPFVPTAQRPLQVVQVWWTRLNITSGPKVISPSGF